MHHCRGTIVSELITNRTAYHAIIQEWVLGSSHKPNLKLLQTCEMVVALSVPEPRLKADLRGVWLSFGLVPIFWYVHIAGEGEGELI